MENEHEIKQGDVLFAQSRYHSIYKVRVLRLTPTTIVLDGNGNYKLKRPFRDGCTAKGTGGYGNTYYYFPTPELEQEFNRVANDRFIKGFKFDNLDNEKTKQLVAFLKSL